MAIQTPGLMKLEILRKKLQNMQEVVRRTIISSQKYKLYDILGANELNICITTLDSLFLDMARLVELINKDDISVGNANTAFKNIETEFLIILKNFGTDNITDLITLLLGDEYIAKHI